MGHFLEGLMSDFRQIRLILEVMGHFLEGLMSDFRQICLILEGHESIFRTNGVYF